MAKKRTTLTLNELTGKEMLLAAPMEAPFGPFIKKSVKKKKMTLKGADSCRFAQELSGAVVLKDRPHSLCSRVVQGIGMYYLIERGKLAGFVETHGDPADSNTLDAFAVIEVDDGFDLLRLTGRNIIHTSHVDADGEMSAYSYDDTKSQMLVYMPFLLAEEEFAHDYEELSGLLDKNLEAVVKDGLQSPDGDRINVLLYRMSQNAYTRMAHTRAENGYDDLREGLADATLTLIKEWEISSNDKPARWWAPSTVNSADWPTEKESVSRIWQVCAGNRDFMEERLNAKPILDGKYALFEKGHWTPSELRRIEEAKKDTSLVMPANLPPLAKMIQASLKEGRYPLNNIMWEGEPGTSKSTSAALLGRLLEVPTEIVVVNEGTEVSDLLCNVVPLSAVANVTDEEVKRGGALMSKLWSSFSSTLEKVLPKYISDKVKKKRENTWERLVEDASDLLDAMSPAEQAAIEKYVKTHDLLYSSNEIPSGFIATESNFVTALKKGYLVEIQEPTLARPAVLTALNSLLEEGLMVNTVTGEVFRRDPKSIVIATTNMNLAGCQRMNQSFISRFKLTQHFDLPTAEEMAERALSRSNNTTLTMDQAIEMANVVVAINEALKDANAENGECGQRSLNSWVEASKYVSVQEAFKLTVLDKACLDLDGRTEMKAICEGALENSKLSKFGSRTI